MMYCIRYLKPKIAEKFMRKPIAMILSAAILTACHSGNSFQNEPYELLAHCGDYTIKKSTHTVKWHQNIIWVNDVRFISDNKREIPVNEYMPFHSYLYYIPAGNPTPLSFNIAVLAAAPDSVTLLRYRDSTEIGKEVCDITELYLKSQLHDNRNRY
ncbi:TPA: hypothetical protein RFU55_004788 [Klebsiella aerogenes]|nr:hypothetical protein [Klebsiella aerogenes]